jgi:hypothetical protein
MAFSKPLEIRRLTYLGVAVLGLAASALALDAYLPLSPRVMEIDLGMERGAQLGSFDKDGEKRDAEADKNPLTMPVQGKFGLIEGLEGSMGVNYIMQDVDGKSGFDRPLLGLKYADTCYHVGGFLAVNLPIGFEEVMKDGGNYASMVFGALYGFNRDRFHLLANAAYTYNTENEDESKKDQLHFFAKPEYPVALAALSKKKQYLGLYLGLNYDFYFNHTKQSESYDLTENLFSLLPGINYTFNRILSSELTLTYPIMGTNASNVQSVRFQLYFSLEETLYNRISG